MVKVLVADDNKYVRMVLKLILEKHGYDVVGMAKNKEEVVREFRELKPDVIIMDLRMPEKGEVSVVATSGIDATEEIKRLNPDVKVVICTAAMQDKYKEHIMDYADAYLTKPYSEKELIGLMEECCKKS